MFAGAGYVVVMPNPRGSIGYGQAFTDAVNGDWGGRPYEDIMSTVDNVSNLPYVDKDRMVAAGASYGGYMIDWMLGHTDRFKALVTHAGVYDLRSEAGSTEELWFVKWEFQGFPWENPEMYEKFSPSAVRQEFQDANAWSHTANSTTASPSARLSSSSLRFRSRRSRRSLCNSPTRDTGF